MTDVDYYEILGVSRDADEATIKKAYRSAAMQFHPDKGGNNGMFRLISNAYETLKDPARRAAYDSSLDRSATPPGPGPDPTETGSRRGESHSTHDPFRRTDRGFHPAAPSSAVDPNGIRWSVHLPADDEKNEQFVKPTKARLRRGASRIADRALLGLTAASGIIAVLDLLRQGPQESLAVVTVLAGSLLLFTLFRLYVALGVLVLTVLGMFGDNHSPDRASTMVWVGLVTVLLVWSALTSTSSNSPKNSRPTELDPDLDKYLREAGVIGAQDAFADLDLSGRPDSPEISEQVARDALMYLTAIPGVRVLRRLSPHGDRKHVVDAAITCGDLVALVTFRSGQPGEYAFSPTRVLTVNGRPHRYGGFLSALRSPHWTKLTAPAQVRRYVLVSSTQGPVTTNSSIGQDGVWLLDLNEGINRIGEWFYSNQNVAGNDTHVGRVDLGLNAALAQHMV